MAPNNQQEQFFEWEMNEDIVISGISGRFAESENIDELAKNLFENVDMITDDERRWPKGLYGIPSRSGKIKDLSKFDAQFFGVHGKQANLMDPQARLLLELTYEAIADAGIPPHSLRGSRTGVYVGACVSEVEEGLAQDVSKVSGYALTGCSRSMFANRISYTFDFQGPSYAMDTACSSSFLAFQQAVLGLRSGQCESAIVGGVNVCLRPVTALQFNKMNMLSADGKCKHMDVDANGYVRSEACVVVYLQRKSQAKRIYGTVIHTKTNTDGYKEEGITVPSKDGQRDLMKDVLEEARIDPNDVSYVEAHGTGTKVGDPAEINAIAEVYCQNRKEPLLIGSVKSNIGHTEPASGLVALAKVLIAFENESIPANLHFNTPNPDIEPLIKGQVKPCIENTPYKGGIVAINSFGFGGVNVHVLIKPNEKALKEESMKIIDKIPRIVTMCGRTEQSVHNFFDFIEKNPKRVTHEFLGLANEVSKVPSTTGMNHRGFLLIKDKVDENEPYHREVIRVPEKRPLWFVFSGMGSQWAAMAKALMPIDIFAKSIHECAEIMKPYNIDLLHLLLEEDDEALDNIIAPFVTIAAVQIGLVDVLRACEIEPDGIVGHSVGELGCAYADGCFTRKQMMLSAYWRGKCVYDYNKHQKGLMAAIGLGWKECAARCPEGVIAACHNSEDSTTISGSYDKVKKFVAELKAENIFAREVKSCNIAFHSPYIGPIGPDLEKALQDVLKPVVPRSPKWVSSSVPEERWDEDDAKYSSPKYYVNNLVSPVLFQEALTHVPKNAILIEFAPHTLLQAILKRSLGSEMVYIGLMKRNNNPDNLDFFLQNLAKLYTHGYLPKIENLYPKVEYPVPRGTQSIGSLISWDHSQNWLVTQYPEYFNPSSSSDYVVKIDINENDDAYLTGHCIDGRNLFPATGYLFLAWKMLAKIKGQFWDRIPIEFENVVIHRATILSQKGPTKFIIRMMETNGEFSISEGGAIVATGKAFMPEEPVLKMGHILDEVKARINEKSLIQLDSRDIYKELRIRGYDYGESFKNLLEAKDDGSYGKVKWTGSWIAFADALLHLLIVGKNTRSLSLPVRFQSIRCDPKEILKRAKEEDNVFEVATDTRVNVIVTPGLEIRGLKTNIASRRQEADKPIIEKSGFIASDEQEALSAADKQQLNEYVQVCSTIAKKVLAKQGKDGNQILGAYKEAKENVISEYLNGPPTDFSLLHALNSLLEEGSYSENLTKSLQKYSNDLNNDLLANVHTRERFLKPSLDYVTDNSPLDLKVGEVNLSNVLVNNYVKNYLLVACNTISYAVGLPSLSTLDVSDVKDSDLTTLEYKVGISPVPSDLSNLNLVVYKDTPISELNQSASDVSTTLSTLQSMVVSNGFILLLLRNKLTQPETLLFGNQNETAAKRVNQFIEKSKSLKLTLVSQRSDSFGNVSILLRKVAPRNASGQALVEIDTLSYNWVNDLKKKIKEYESRSESDNIWVVSSDTKNGVIGFAKCLRLEPSTQKVRCILHDGSKGKVDFKNAPFNEILEKDLKINVIKDGVVGNIHHISMKPIEDEAFKETEHAYLNVMKKGDLSSLRWYESNNKYHHQTPENGQLCQVYYSPLNFRDIMLATGKLPPDALPGDMALQECLLGLEFAGRDPNGRRVMGMMNSQGMATTVVVNDPDFLWEIPENWTMEEASSVPVVYSTAYYSLIVRGNLQPGESVLIHSGSGGVGQAAISICLSMGCQVFTTVGSKDKREFLKKQFPQLKDRNIANSRNTSFEQHVLRETKGRGVDVVLNSLSEEKLHASIRCLAQHGRFLEIGKYDLSQNNPIGLSAFLKNIAFHGILLDSLFKDGSAIAPGLLAQKQMVAQLVKEGIKTGAVKPLKRNVFTVNEVEEAFRFMASGKHIGKVIIKIRDEEPGAIVAPSSIKIRALARTIFHPKKTYIVAGGVGGFGLELVHWMVRRGAKHIVLTSRSGPKDGYQQQCLKKLKSQGINIVITKANIATEDGCKQLFKEATAIAPVGGVFNLAMVLNDSLFENQTVEKFESTCKPKVQGTINLDKISRQVCPDLEYFVVFSSISCGRGNPGQSNYGFANSVMERVCEQRKKEGLAATAVQWGSIGDVGVVAESDKLMNRVIFNSVPQRIPSCMITLDRFIQSPYAVCASYVRNDQTVKVTAKDQGLIAVISNIVGVKNPATLHPSISLSDLGVDSLMSVEIKQTLEREYDIILSAAEIRSLTIHKLKEIDQGNADILKSESASNQSEVTIPLITVPSEIAVRLNQVTDGQPIFFLPPIEGVFNLLAPIASFLSRPAIGIQWTHDFINLPSIEAAAALCLKECRKHQPEGPIDLIGYSFGTIINYEMACQGEVGTMIFLDGSPKMTTKNIDLYRQKVQASTPVEKEIEASIIFLSQFVPIEHIKTKAELLALPETERKKRLVEMYIEKGGPACDPNELATATEAFNKKCQIALSYETNKKIKHDKSTLLIRCDEHAFGSEKFPEDYFLSESIDGPVTIRTLKGNHRSFLSNNQREVAVIINDHL